MSNLEHTADKVISEGKNSMKSLKDGAYDIGDEIKDMAGDITKVACEQAAVINDNVVEFIKQNPYKSVIATFLTGLLIAKLI